MAYSGVLRNWMPGDAMLEIACHSGNTSIMYHVNEIV